jgi:hypothetical protein
VLNGYKVIQSWDALVYHFTSRGSRFNKHAGGGAGINSTEWVKTTTKNTRNFIRKWGHFVKHDSLMKPIITPRYLVGFYINHCSLDLLNALEPWCTTVYVENIEHRNTPQLAKRAAQCTKDREHKGYMISRQLLPQSQTHRARGATLLARIGKRRGEG